MWGLQTTQVYSATTLEAESAAFPLEVLGENPASPRPAPGVGRHSFPLEPHHSNLCSHLQFLWPEPRPAPFLEGLWVGGGKPGRTVETKGKESSFS